MWWMMRGTRAASAIATARDGGFVACNASSWLSIILSSARHACHRIDASCSAKSAIPIAYD